MESLPRTTSWIPMSKTQHLNSGQQKNFSTCIPQAYNKKNINRKSACETRGDFKGQWRVIGGLYQRYSLFKKKVWRRWNKEWMEFIYLIIYLFIVCANANHAWGLLSYISHNSFHLPLSHKKLICKIWP